MRFKRYHDSCALAVSQATKDIINKHAPDELKNKIKEALTEFEKVERTLNAQAISKADKKQTKLYIEKSRWDIAFQAVQDFQNLELLNKVREARYWADFDTNVSLLLQATHLQRTIKSMIKEKHLTFYEAQHLCNFLKEHKTAPRKNTEKRSSKKSLQETLRTRSSSKTSTTA